MKRLARVLLAIELVVCFAPATIMLAFGVLLIPLGVMGAAFRGVFHSSHFFALIMVLAGLLGLTGLQGLISLVMFGKPSKFSNRAVLALSLVGMAALVPIVVSDSWWRLIGVFPILASLHLVYLARGYLFDAWTGDQASAR